ncbi:methylated-DNA--[protein]-cysteine S-methyltransferase [Altibacter sp.]|uniref:methylated-DNA--[protein]-cysteine S-methyltransferase n=1 Tax=Altibacter sp. TaxID=2024823 RepID=UPI000C92FE65|nr:methylated-DNA--[protein]-cysteine S-methyltransferase [Altibacter sp.]MAP53576.1 cysteine methyltransferase [Altibacter sp.]|tara:strand:- start:419 stop:892 length:474 start_codon:yes stop_codon:yes gene_type:complete
MKTGWLESPIGLIQLEGTASGLAKVSFVSASEGMASEIPSELEEAAKQLTEYFAGDRSHFTIALAAEGTEFQKRVWKLLTQIPFGKTVSYQSMANRLGDPKVIRAAAAANGKNPIAILIPCHRVIGSDGSLTGYAGGLERKKWLLAHENPVKQTSLF